MSWLDRVQGPSDAELWAIELDGELLGAELRLIEAELTLTASSGRASAAAYLQALLDVVDLHDFTAHCGEVGPGPATGRCDQRRPETSR